LLGSAHSSSLSSLKNSNIYTRKEKKSKRVSCFIPLMSFIVFFLIKGEAAYVLPRYDNTIYIRIEDGDHFGHVDIVFDQEARDLGLPVKLLRPEKYVITRKFTV
jgi:hypothetical protein